jgi:nitroreductase
LPAEFIVDPIYRRRSVRAYSDKQVGESVLRELLDAAVQAPSAMHLEPWAFAVIQDKAVLKRYSDRAKSILRAPDRAVGWGSAGRAPSDHPSMLDDPAFNIFYDAGTLIVVCRRQEGHFADAGCWLAAENLMLAAAQRGLGTCCIGFAVPVLNKAAVKRELGIPPEGAAVAPIIVGYPRGEVPAVPRKAPHVLAWVKQ